MIAPQDYFNTGGLNARVCVPAYERMKQLYAMGYSNPQISQVLNTEFQDIDLNSITPAVVQKLIGENHEEFLRARTELGLACRKELQDQLAVMFNLTSKVEVKMVGIYVEKLDKVLDSLADLDLDEIDDETGNYKNTARTFVLLELAEKYQSKIAKIVGTDALREIEVFRAKAKAKREEEEKGTGLIPAFGRDVSSGTTFIK